MKRVAIRTPEGQVKKAVMDLLAAYKIPAFRMNAGDRFGSYKGRKWRIAGHAPGTADILALPWIYKGDEARLAAVWIECKAPGKELSKLQENFRDWAIVQGHDYLLVDDAAQLDAWIKLHEAHN